VRTHRLLGRVVLKVRQRDEAHLELVAGCGRLALVRPKLTKRECAPEKRAEVRRLAEELLHPLLRLEEREAIRRALLASDAAVVEGAGHSRLGLLLGDGRLEVAKGSEDRGQVEEHAGQLLLREPLVVVEVEHDRQDAKLLREGVGARHHERRRHLDHETAEVRVLDARRKRPVQGQNQSLLATPPHRPAQHDLGLVHVHERLVHEFLRALDLKCVQRR